MLPGRGGEMKAEQVEEDNTEGALGKRRTGKTRQLCGIDQGS